MPSPRNLAELVRAETDGAALRYVFFLDYGGSYSEHLAEACLSQWWPSPFCVGGQEFRTAEQYMMLAKAELFGDREAASKILGSKTPFQAQLIGQKVRGFDQGLWEAERERIVFEGNLAKFSQDHGLGAFLLATENDILAEASSQDLVWGTGFGMDDPTAKIPSRWPGQNLLGFCLMRVREALRTRDSDKDGGFGMWANRSDLSDPNAFVRKIRRGRF
jgi:ribA/ribD-fused uncharacterized protein